MNYLKLFFILIVVIFTNCSGELKFKDIKKIDAHVHLRISWPDIQELAVCDNFELINIITDHYDVDKQKSFFYKQQVLDLTTLGFVTSFYMKGWDNPVWLENTMNVLSQELSEGAIAVKVWKNIGMEFRDASGDFVMIDNPKFNPIFELIQYQGKTLTAHIGEPRDCWLPVEKMIAASNKGYFSRNPQYHMYKHPEYPSYEDLIRSIENVLNRYPDMKYVGCHLASIEWSTEELGAYLDRHPNAAVDLSARIDDIQFLDQSKVRDFFLNYQNRLLYATDFGVDEDSNKEATVKRLHDTWRADWRYFATDSLVTIKGTDKRIPGLKLPKTVLEKIYYKNAKKWYFAE
jgi:hypothetical protein